jgi:hypothetical protein
VQDNLFQKWTSSFGEQVIEYANNEASWQDYLHLDTDKIDSGIYMSLLHVNLWYSVGWLVYFDIYSLLFMFYLDECKKNASICLLLSIVPPERKNNKKCSVIIY